MGSDLHWAIKDHQERTYGQLLEAIRQALTSLKKGYPERAQEILEEALKQAKFNG